MSDDPFAAAAAETERLIRAHEETRGTKRYTDAEKHLHRLVQDFVVGLRAAWLAFTRYPNHDRWLLQRSTDDLLESAIALPALARDGIFNVARRELRYLLEASVKFVYVDQKLEGDEALENRIELLGDNSKVPRSSVDPIDGLAIRLLDEPEDFRQAVKGRFAALSGYVHPSRPAVEERLKRAERGEFSGFEGPAVLEAFNGVAAQTLDLVLVLILEGVGPSFTGDLFVEVFDGLPDWKFHRTKFVRQVSRHFDYKANRASVE